MQLARARAGVRRTATAQTEQICAIPKQFAARCDVQREGTMRVLRPAHVGSALTSQHRRQRKHEEAGSIGLEVLYITETDAYIRTYTKAFIHST